MVSAWMLEKYFETHQKYNNAFSSNIHQNVLHEKKPQLSEVEGETRDNNTHQSGNHISITVKSCCLPQSQDLLSTL